MRFSDVLYIAASLLGAAFGYIVGQRLLGTFGSIVGIVVGIVVGVIVGFVVAHLPLLVGVALAGRSLHREPTQALQARLRSAQEHLDTHLFLAELISRGEDITPELPYVLALMRSSTSVERRSGWRALQVGFPVLAAQIPQYNPEGPSASCQSQVSTIGGSA